MRATEKFLKGVETLQNEKLPMPFPRNNEHVNDALERNGFCWNVKKKAWEKESKKPSTIASRKD